MKASTINMDIYFTGTMGILIKSTLKLLIYLTGVIYIYVNILYNEGWFVTDPKSNLKWSPVHRMLKKRSQSGCRIISFCFFGVTVEETSVCYISRLFSEIPRRMIYQRKADFLINLVTGVRHNWPS